MSARNERIHKRAAYHEWYMLNSLRWNQNNFLKQKRLLDHLRVAEIVGEGILYWKSGGGQHTTSLGVNSIRSPIDLPLFKIDLLVKQAAFGAEVVLLSQTY
jgi:hypothetical protein